MSNSDYKERFNKLVADLEIARNQYQLSSLENEPLARTEWERLKRELNELIASEHLIRTAAKK
ncbi:MAG TPA: hypothetical protein VK974_07670 [Methylophilaceae bacterium]|nr:hypothetical protein [Methylophilaceae bacterium]